MKKLNLKNMTLLFAMSLATFFVACDGKKQEATTEVETTEEESEETPAPRESPKMTATGTIGGANITITYGSPAVKGREVWGKLVPYNEVWRTGANEATTIQTDKDLSINGGILPAGKYSVFTIPAEDEWTVIFNKTSEQWGAYEYEESEDQLRVKANVMKTPELNERLNFTVNGEGFITMVWEMIQLTLEVK